jgi:hypothetical protein
MSIFYFILLFILFNFIILGRRVRADHGQAARRSFTRAASSPLRAFGSALDSRGVDLWMEMDMQRHFSLSYF